MVDWTVYIVACRDGTLYTGVTNDLTKRLNAHNRGCGAKYTKTRLPVSLLAFRDGFTKSQALQLEYKVKQQRRENKAKFLGIFVFPCDIGVKGNDHEHDNQ